MVMRVFARRSQAYLSNSHIFLVWMVGTSLVLLTIAVLFLRNQIRPILQLADAAEAFGKGRDLEVRPRGAREVRRAGYRPAVRTVLSPAWTTDWMSEDGRRKLTEFGIAPPPGRAAASGPVPVTIGRARPTSGAAPGSGCRPRGRPPPGAAAASRAPRSWPRWSPTTAGRPTGARSRRCSCGSSRCTRSST